MPWSSKRRADKHQTSPRRIRRTAAAVSCCFAAMLLLLQSIVFCCCCCCETLLKHADRLLVVEHDCGFEKTSAGVEWLRVRSQRRVCGIAGGCCCCCCCVGVFCSSLCVRVSVLHVSIPPLPSYHIPPLRRFHSQLIINSQYGRLIIDY